MDEEKIIYWTLIAGLTAVFAAGIWLAFFADALLEKRGRMAEARLGKKATAFFISTLRVLGLTVALLALYLLVNLFRLFQCAIR